jgi:hypothetical protein
MSNAAASAGGGGGGGAKFSFTVNEDEFTAAYKQHFGHSPPSSAFSKFVDAFNRFDFSVFEENMIDEVLMNATDLPVWESVINEPGEPFKEYCGDIPSLAKFKAYKYYAINGGCGGFIMKKLGDRVKVRKVSKVKPFIINRTFYAKVSVKKEGESNYICVEEPEVGDETDSD